MIIASSDDDNCIKSLMFILEKNYPGISFEIHISKTSRIEIPDDETELWEELNKGLFKRLEDFCEGFVLGWDQATS